MLMRVKTHLAWQDPGHYCPTDPFVGPDGYCNTRDPFASDGKHFAGLQDFLDCGYACYPNAAGK